MKTIKLSMTVTRDEGEVQETAELRYSTACNRIVIVGDLFPAEYSLFNSLIESVKRDTNLFRNQKARAEGSSQQVDKSVAKLEAAINDLSKKGKAMFS